jgi:para-aminobenzoate synthetase component 1
VLRQDRDGHWWYERLFGATLSGWVVEALRNPLAPRHFNITWGDADRDARRRGVLECLEAIAAGEVYQTCVCTQFAGRPDGAPVDFFVEAVERTSPARAAYLAGEWGTVASLSPELFLRRSGETVTSSSIKGTLPRYADPAALRASVKDVAENIMIVDLVRNDLGRVAITGTVTLPMASVWMRRSRPRR